MANKNSNLLMYAAMAVGAYFLLNKKNPVRLPPVLATEIATSPGTSSSGVGVTAGQPWVDYTLDHRYRRTHTPLRDGNISIFIEDLQTGQTATILVRVIS